MYLEEYVQSQYMILRLIKCRTNNYLILSFLSLEPTEPSIVNFKRNILRSFKL